MFSDKDIAIPNSFRKDNVGQTVHTNNPGNNEQDWFTGGGVYQAGFDAYQQVNFTYNADIAVVALYSECKGFNECRVRNTSAGIIAHPTKQSRWELSANKDVNRFDKCVKAPVYDGASTICVECMHDCDCNPGQFCQLDIGADVVGNFYNSIDPSSRAKFGTCQKKNIPLVCANTFARSTEDSFRASTHNYNLSDWTHNGFCGEALYFRTDVTVDPIQQISYATLSQVVKPNSVRLPLWTGVCDNHVCKECQEGAFSCSNTWVCVNGRYTKNQGNVFGKLGLAAEQAGRSTAQDTEKHLNDQMNIQYAIVAITFVTAIMAVIILLWHCCCAPKRGDMPKGTSGPGGVQMT